MSNPAVTSIKPKPVGELARARFLRRVMDCAIGQQPELRPHAAPAAEVLAAFGLATERHSPQSLTRYTFTPQRGRLG